MTAGAFSKPPGRFALPRRGDRAAAALNDVLRADPGADGPLASVTPVATLATLATILTHRECAPEHAGTVRAMCLTNPAVLPRWHQEDRGKRNEHAGVHEIAPAGAYAAVPTWSGRKDWLTFVVPLAIAQGAEILRKHEVSAAALRDWAKVKSGYVPQDCLTTGRRVIVRPKTLASVLGFTERYIKALNACARELGLEVVAQVGRMLKQDERKWCYDNGSRQRGLATEVALTVPAAVRLARQLARRAGDTAVDSFTPPKRLARQSPTSRSNGVPSRPSGREGGVGSADPASTKAARRRRTRRLATEVARSVPWLASERLGRLTPPLTRFANAAEPWTAADIVGMLEEHTLRTGRMPIEQLEIRTTPAAVLASILRGVDPVDDLQGPAFSSVDRGVDPTPCGGPSCDGHGWITPDAGPPTRCPDCPPSIRTWRPDVEAAHLDEFGDPPF